MNRINRLLVIIGLCALAFTSCKKATQEVLINPDQAAIDDKIVTDYLAANGLTDSVKRVENGTHPDTIGVWYQVIKQGPIATLYNASSSRVTVGYTGRLLTTGAVFTQTDTYHPSFTLGEVIRGWRLGIPKVYKGGIVRLFITSRYAYGPYAQTSIGLPANAVLDFTIEVFDVTN